MYSQNKEDSIITDYFKGRTGTLLDIGAYDCVSFSNSRWLIELGLAGALIEPLPEAARKYRAPVTTLSIWRAYARRDGSSANP
jgi:hypothetical protein